MDIKILNLNNKSRRGTYIYIKAPNKPSRYYKYEPNTIIDAYKHYYNDTYQKKDKKGTLQQYKTTYQTKTLPTRQKIARNRLTRSIEQYISKLKKRGKLVNAIKKGITATRIKDALTATNTDIRKAKTDLLKELVLDKQLLKILIQDENFKKLSSRLEYRLEITDKTKGTLITTSKFNTTPEKVIQELKETMRKGEHVETGSGKVTRKLKRLGYINPQTNQSGDITSIPITIIFQKAK